MKSILQSIKPQYCELIASGKKTIEVRKTRPKLDVSFKVYIYCTKDGFYGLQSKSNPALKTNASGKVIGEYVCHTITKYTTEFHPANDLFQGIWETVYNEDADDEYDNIVTSNDFDYPDNCDICKRSCLSFEDIKNYIGYGDHEFYAWHISDLKIYDKPKELSEFEILCKEYDKDNPDCESCDYQSATCDCDTPPQFDCKCNGLKPLTCPPQSWCYVEEV